MLAYGILQYGKKGIERPGYRGTLFPLHQRQEMVQCTKSYPIALEHGGHQVPGKPLKRDQMIGQTLAMTLDQRNDLGTLLRIESGSPQAKHIEESVVWHKDNPDVAKDIPFGLSPWTDLYNADSGKAKYDGVDGRVLGHVGVTMRPAYGSNGTWIYYMVRDTPRGRASMARFLQRLTQGPITDLIPNVELPPLQLYPKKTFSTLLAGTLSSRRF